jgi:hypothetical protein
MKQPSQYRKLMYLEARIGIARNVIAIVWMLWSWH